MTLDASVYNTIMTTETNVFGCLIPKAQEALKKYLRANGGDPNKIVACTFAGGKVFLYSLSCGKTPEWIIQISDFYQDQSNSEKLAHLINLLPKEIGDILTLCQRVGYLSSVNEDDGTFEQVAGEAAEAIEKYQASANALLESMKLLVCHVAHYAAMPHAHSDADKHVAQARAALTKAGGKE